MNKAAELYDRAAVCHQRAGRSLKETEQKGWFELACIWLMLADNVSARMQLQLQLQLQDALAPSAEEMV